MSQLADVNTTHIDRAIVDGCRTMQQVFNADDDDIPFFGSLVRPVAELRFDASHSEAHVPGRHLNALLAAEAALGLTLDPAAIAKHARAASFAYSGPVPLPLNRSALGGRLSRFLPHNLREGFHALYALRAFRGSEESEQLAARSIAAIDALWTPEAGWRREPLEDDLGIDLIEWGTTDSARFVTGIARALGPLAKYWAATAYQPALDLALRLKTKLVEEVFTADGSYDSARFGTHVHSTTATLASLAQLAELTGDRALLDRVQVFYDHGLGELRDAIGWSIENSAPGADPDRGEANNTGDILETALILGRHVDARYFSDAERILRCHLLPSQLRDISFIGAPPDSAGGDGRRAIAERHRGAFGFPAPYGHEPIGARDVSFNMDIVGGAVASLVAAYQAVTHTTPNGHYVNLLFDHESAALRVESPYTHPALRILVKQPAPVHIRIPPWLTPEEIHVAGTDELPSTERGYLRFSRPPTGQPLTLSFPLKLSELTLRHRTRRIRARLRGDAIVAMENFGADLTFFDPLPQQ